MVPMETDKRVQLLIVGTVYYWRKTDRHVESSLEQCRLGQTGWNQFIRAEVARQQSGSVCLPSGSVLPNYASASGDLQRRLAWILGLASLPIR